MPHPSKKLSVIMPVYNEATTFTRTLDAVLQQDLGDIAKEIIIVESNSQDGTREQVLRYRDLPEVKIILEDQPSGKGHAVRAGLLEATGNYILIQDADDEYDVGDYPKLLAPLIAGTHKLVLGSRHSRERRSWKIRQFKGHAFSRWLLNLGHIFFTQLFNLTYGQRLKDPFTMYKVFRRECLNGLEFESNRFDFDWELLGKLCRKGYRPIEIPISYTSRSFDDGKKVSIFRDPITWIIACFKFKFCPLLHKKSPFPIKSISDISKMEHIS